jgi:type IV secretory pathway TrbD component
VETTASRLSPLYPVLTEPLLFLGAERDLALAHLVVAAGLILGMHWYLFAPFWAANHGLLVRLARRDPQMRPVYFRYVRQANRYTPWAGIRRCGFRPSGFAAESTLC